MRYNQWKFLLLLLAPLMLQACITSWVLKKEERLYAGASIKLRSDTTVEKKRALKAALNNGLYPITNSMVVGMPVRLWVFRMLGEPSKTGGLRYYLKYNYGEPPVLITDVPVADVSVSLQNILKANGFLDAEVTAESHRLWWSKIRWKETYTCTLHAPYHLRKITTTVGDSSMQRILKPDSAKTLIHTGDRYTLNDLTLERKRVDNILKNNGYFYFSPNYLLFAADSSVGGKQIDIAMQIRQDVDPAYLKPWYINKVLVNANSLHDSIISDTTNIEGVWFTGNDDFRPKRLRRFVLFKKGDLIISDDYNATNKNLSSLGAFKFANIDFEPDTILDNNLNISINLIANKSKSVGAEVDVISKSTSFIGPGIELSHTNHNFLHGGEQLSVKLGGSIEGWATTTDAGETLGSFNYEISNTNELNIPRFLLINPNRFSQRFIPYTNFTLQLRLVKQVQYYKMSIFRSSFGYRWSENKNQYHELNWVDVSFQHVFQGTNAFDSLLLANTLLKRSFDDQLIIGSNYTYRYSLPATDLRRFKTAFTGTIDVAGNSIYAIQKLLGVTSKPYTLIGTVYSEYAKLTLDFRSYWTLSPRNKIAMRTVGGIGIPIGNSDILPNIKQYFVGGANSIRAFQPRSIGPGSYLPVAAASGVLLDQTGDIQLEGNIENRFQMTRLFELALFLDVGNVWLARNDAARPGAQFDAATFYKQLAAGWGAGLRYLNPYFIIRVDVGYPLKRPNTTISLGNWKKPVFNLAIGYPF